MSLNSFDIDMFVLIIKILFDVIENRKLVLV